MSKDKPLTAREALSDFGRRAPAVKSGWNGHEDALAETATDLNGEVCRYSSNRRHRLNFGDINQVDDYDHDD